LREAADAGRRTANFVVVGDGGPHRATSRGDAVAANVVGGGAAAASWRLVTYAFLGEHRAATSGACVVVAAIGGIVDDVAACVGASLRSDVAAFIVDNGMLLVGLMVLSLVVVLMM
jgi:hypothetical protein